MNKIKSLTFDNITYYSLIIFALTIPLSRVSISFFLFWFLILVIVKRDYKNSFLLLKENKIFIYFGFFLLFIMLNSLWSSDYERMLNNLGKYSYWIIVPMIVILMKEEWTYKILNAFLLSMFISEVISYGIYFGIFTIFKGTMESPSPFMNSINYSVFLAFTALVLLYRFLFENSSYKIKAIMLFFFIMTTTNLLLSIGRTGQLAFFVTLFIVFIIKYRITLKSIVLSTIFVILISLVAYNTLDLFKKRVDSAIVDIEKVVLNNDFESSWGIRAAYWILTYDAFKEQPIFGHGLGDYREVAKRFILEENRYPYFSKYINDFMTTHRYHNQYLMFIVEGGLIGLFIFLIFIYKLYKLEVRDKELKHISIIGITVFIIAFFGDTLLYLKFPQSLFLFIVSLTIVGSKISENNQINIKKDSNIEK
ncbi:O-antigen ligase family protein [Arcobacter porcinus]|uniref:O-antigen ligase family protein n=1 Tax=Arcobacter porcinus TaxID=1935204 RepID=UPI0008243674|nr:O-antigen ligase family protein [Arcobacter porcinus]OCL83690.1 O-Antigen ligase [Arcobacter porcinus]OCL85823.1 O-Antigen ligase [Arcobacter porcinus]